VNAYVSKNEVEAAAAKKAQEFERNNDWNTGWAEKQKKLKK